MTPHAVEADPRRVARTVRPVKEDQP